MKTIQTASSIFSVIISFLASQHHNLHMLVLLMLGGSTNMMDSMGTLFIVRRIMIVLTLATVIWSLYRLYKHKCRQKWLIGMTAISSVVSITFIAKTLMEFGW